MNKIKQLSVLGLITILFNACGGSGGENSISSGVQNDSTSSFGEYVKYNWSLNTNIDSQFKDDYSIDEYAHINIDPAWTKTKGMTTNSEKIKVAVIDQDFDITHPDIKDKIIATYNAMDDTLNVTNINAYDEPFSHGTATAGVIAANDIGVAPEVELILINVNFDDSQFNNIQSVDSFINAFLKAEELGAKVINCSWGGDFISADLSFELARLKGEGINIVFASGNDEYDLDEIMEEEYTDANDEVQTREVEKYDSEAEDVSVIGVGASTISNDVAS